MGKLEGKIALVTGGTSGIGLATAKQFVNEGAYVYITGRREQELDATVKEIGKSVAGVQGDVSKLADLNRMFARIESENGRLDVLFANAGTAKYGRLGEITEELFDSIFDTNVKGVLFTVQKALPLLTKGSSVIITGSTTSIMGTASFSVYSEIDVWAPGDPSVTNIRIEVDFFWTLTPWFCTAWGNCASATETRFCTSTCAKLRSVPILNVTVRL